MIIYLLNFVFCSGVLIAVYYLFLAREQMYGFNRFYLLLSLAFSLIVPLMHISIPSTAPVIKPEIAGYFIVLPSTGSYSQPVSPSSAISIWPYVLMVVYALITAVMLCRFFRNLYCISHKIKTSECIKNSDSTFVLTIEALTPHSFLRYVFLNKAEYEQGLIEPEVICHELTHVRQRHSIDVIFIELVQAVCWFNPFVPLFRKAVQLNHEFLADECVIQSYHNVTTYQCLLLAKASASQSLYLTSQFNYLTTKKRLIMMTKFTPANVVVLKQLALLPILTCALFLFANKVFAQAKPTVANQKINAGGPDGPVSITDVPITPVGEYEVILKKYDIPNVIKKGKPFQPRFTDEDRQRLSLLYKKMTKQQQRQQWVMFMPKAKPLAKGSPTAQQLKDWQDAGNYGVWIDGKKVNNAELANYKPSEFNQFFVSKLTPAAIHHTKYHYQVDLMTGSYYADYYNKSIADKHDVIFIHQPSKGL